MVARISAQEVKDIMDISLDNEDITPFINTANIIVNDVLIGQGYGSNTLVEIEKWLSAHFVSIRSPQVKQEKIGDASVVYQSGVVAKGLESTLYGQQVKLLDYKGVLSSLGKRVAKIETINFIEDSS